MDNSIKRNYSLDIARILAVLAVVMIHCSASFVTAFKPLSSEFVFGSIFDGLARYGVPVFLMISGALFLDESKAVTLKDILSKNVKSLAIITVIWAVIYSLFSNVLLPVVTNNPVSLNKFIRGSLLGHYHMWYLYMIIGVYLVTPFLKKFVCKENHKMVLFFIAVSLVAQFSLPLIDKLCATYFDIEIIGLWIEKFDLSFFGGYITYYLSGWYIAHVGIKQKFINYVIYCLGLVSVLSIVFYVLFTGDYNLGFENIGLPVFTYSVSIFLAVQNLKLNLKDKTAKIIVTLSKLTFGVYIIHVMILTLIVKLLPYKQNSLLYIVLTFVAVVVFSFAGSYIISKIPFVKKLIKA